MRRELSLGNDIRIESADRISWGGLRLKVFFGTSRMTADTSSDRAPISMLGAHAPDEVVGAPQASFPLFHGLVEQIVRCRCKLPKWVTGLHINPKWVTDLQIKSALDRGTTVLCTLPTRLK